MPLTTARKAPVILKIVQQASIAMCSLGGFFLPPVRVRNWRNRQMAENEGRKRNLIELVFGIGE
jgi:hypothetical protein